jgi:RNA polymerase sigma-70 factor, ECF subfamily
MDLPIEQYRAELFGYAYRMLGSGFEADDAVQETLVRAWQRFDHYDAQRAPLRTWLYAIATNVCIDMLRGARRRARAMDLGPASPAGAALGTPLPEDAWIQPVPDSRVLPAESDPAELATLRDSVRLAFMAALQHLPPRQRAVLILRDVLCWSAAEVAGLLETSVASVNSALQRGRRTIERADGRSSTPNRSAPMDLDQTLLARYCDAFERYDVEALVALLHEDATMSMPPFPWWLQGTAAIRRALLAAGHPCKGARLVPLAANGTAAFAQYRPADADSDLVAFALVLLDVSAGSITATTTYLDPERLFPLFGLPLRTSLVPQRGAASAPG